VVYCDGRQTFCSVQGLVFITTSSIATGNSCIALVRGRLTGQMNSLPAANWLTDGLRAAYLVDVARAPVSNH